jgi:hypothetical protein
LDWANAENERESARSSANIDILQKRLQHLVETKDIAPDGFDKTQVPS